MQATAKALKERSLDMFKDALKEYQERESFQYERAPRVMADIQNSNKTP
jgi:hypothetical protein